MVNKIELTFKKSKRYTDIKSLAENYLSQTIKDEKGCWNLTCKPNTGGYSKTTFKGKRFLVHRLVYQAIYGDLKKELFVCHKCDNVRCVNPDHLYQGTAKQNHDDKIKRNRHPNSWDINKEYARLCRSKSRGCTKLDKLKSIEIGILIMSGMKQNEIAKIYGVTPSAISKLKKRNNA
jgi:hypothetical protein